MTVEAAAENVPDDAPAATVTVAGTCTFALLLDKLTEAPPDGAAALSVTVPVALPGPTKLDGLNESELTTTC